MNRKHILGLLILLSSCGTGSSDTSTPENREPVLVKAPAAPVSGSDKVITWATNPQYPPYDWAADGVYKGAGPDLLPLLIPEGYRLEPKMVPWARAQEMARYGEIDLLVNIRLTPQRSEYLVFAQEPTFYNPITVFVKSDSLIPFKSWDELIPLRGGRAKGDTYGNGFDEYINANVHIDEANTMAQNFMKLDEGRIDFFTTGYYSGQTWLASAKMESKIKALFPPVSNNSITLGFSKKSPYVSLLPEINRRLKQLQKTGIPEKLLEAHMETFTSLPLKEFP